MTIWYFGELAKHFVNIVQIPICFGKGIATISWVSQNLFAEIMLCDVMLCYQRSCYVVSSDVVLSHDKIC